MSGARRFVFELTNTGNEITEGKTPELRGCATAADAEAEMATWAIVREGAKARLLGYRDGILSGSRFYPLVPVDEIPWHIIQNERFGIEHEAARAARFERETGMVA